MSSVEAKYYRVAGEQIECWLCPHNCLIAEGKRGICRVRKNHKGKLFSEVYGQLVAKHMDPIEKKPLYHFYPGEHILSIGTAGCNMRCFFCQNFGISQTGAESYNSLGDTYPSELIELSKRNDNLGIAYTYNEPTVFYEYMYDTSVKAKKENLKTVVVSNGFISPDPLKDLIPYIDAFNIDLKSFSHEFYRKHTKSELEPVKTTLQIVGESGKHLEITILVIPGLNDDMEEFLQLIDWVYSNFGAEQVLHISRFFPNYKSNISTTPLSTLENFRKIAMEKLYYVYLGNTSIPEGQNTYCPSCHGLVIERNYFGINQNINESGECKYCGQKILDHFENGSKH